MTVNHFEYVHRSDTFVASALCLITGILTARGQVVKILPHYPLDGQPATVEIHDIQSLISSDETMKELQNFPGPLVR
jgi:hypothetical protein